MNADRFALPAQSRLAGLLVAALMLALTIGAGSASAQRAPSAAAATSAQAPAVGLLARGSGYGSRADSPTVRALQRRLRDLDTNPGPIDGLYGPQTQAAVERFQTTHHLAIDGIAGPQTQHALRQASTARTLAYGAGYDTPNGSQHVRALQRHLQRAGQPPGPIDGLYGPQTQAAVAHYQTTHGLTPDGIAGPQTDRRLPSRALEHPGRGGHRTAGGPTPPSRPHTGVHPAPRSLAKPASEPVPVLVLALAAWLIALALITLRVRGRAKRAAAGAGMAAERRTDPPALAAAAAGGAGRPHHDHNGASELVARPLPTTDDSRVGERVAQSVGLPVLGYVRVPDSRGRNGDAFRAQAEAIDHACEARGLRLISLVRDHESQNGERGQRPGLSHALKRVAAGEATGLVVASLEHLSSSAVELGALIEWFSKRDARLVAADLQLDTGTDSGRRAAQTLASVSRLEPDKPAQHPRTRRTPANGRQISRSAASDRPELRDRIAGMRAKGMTLQAIADTLNTEGVPTLRGGALWRRSSVHTAAGYKRPSKKPSRDQLPSTDPPFRKHEKGPDDKGQPWLR